MVPAGAHRAGYGEVTNVTAEPAFTCVPTAGVEPVTVLVGFPATPLTVSPNAVSCALASAMDLPTIVAGIVTGLLPLETVTVTALPFAAVCPAAGEDEITMFSATVSEYSSTRVTFKPSASSCGVTSEIGFPAI